MGRTDQLIAIKGRAEPTECMVCQSTAADEKHSEGRSVAPAGAFCKHTEPEVVVTEVLLTGALP